MWSCERVKKLQKDAVTKCVLRYSKISNYYVSEKDYSESGFPKREKKLKQ